MSGVECNLIGQELKITKKCACSEQVKQSHVYQLKSTVFLTYLIIDELIMDDPKTADRHHL